MTIKKTLLIMVVALAIIIGFGLIDKDEVKASGFSGNLSISGGVITEESFDTETPSDEVIDTPVVEVPKDTEPSIEEPVVELPAEENKPVVDETPVDLEPVIVTENKVPAVEAPANEITTIEPVNEALNDNAPVVATTYEPVVSSDNSAEISSEEVVETVKVVAPAISREVENDYQDASEPGTNWLAILFGMLLAIVTMFALRRYEIVSVTLDEEGNEQTSHICSFFSLKNACRALYKNEFEFDYAKETIRLYDNLKRDDVAHMLTMQPNNLPLLKEYVEGRKLRIINDVFLTDESHKLLKKFDLEALQMD